MSPPLAFFHVTVSPFLIVTVLTSNASPLKTTLTVFGVAEGDALALGDAEALTVALTVGEADAVGMALALTVAVAVGVVEGDAS